MIREMKIIDDQTQVSIAGSIYVEDANKLREELATLIEKRHKSLLIDLSQRGLFPIPQNHIATSKHRLSEEMAQHDQCEIMR